METRRQTELTIFRLNLLFALFRVARSPALEVGHTSDKLVPVAGKQDIVVSRDGNGDRE